ncbi:Inositol-tetrakisphosphate 1-kinase [Artemisia annua]|uniref:Inositol-tetrakisphosphate 1-kinase n=1 Tax=Artemisia annua TaxID=35608 RepID=A0A2U1M421_ARTAN|nr:Inositol-tetrakisphosphate 1-kinase [Artemisia annua]
MVWNKGIFFVPIDQTRSLSDQGPFDIVPHKLTGKEWRKILEDYRLSHPEVTVLDPPDAIQHVYNRQSMLQDVVGLDLSTHMSWFSYLVNFLGTVGVPKQLVIEEDPSSIPNAIRKAGLSLPLGGVLFKVYIVGDEIKVVWRFSLPDVSKRELSGNSVVFHFPRVSSAAQSADDADVDPCIGALLERIARALRCRLVILMSLLNTSSSFLLLWPTHYYTTGLDLFNMDMIRGHGTRDRFYVIDINCFPGYGKMPEYKHIFTDFLLSLVLSKCLNKGSTHLLTAVNYCRKKWPGIGMIHHPPSILAVPLVFDFVLVVLQEKYKNKPWILEDETGQFLYQGVLEGAQTATYCLLML